MGRGWLGRAMVLGSFQYRPGRPTILAYGRAGGLLCLQQVRDGWAFFFFFFFFFFLVFCFCFCSSHLSYLPFLFGDGWTC